MVAIAPDVRSALAVLQDDRASEAERIRAVTIVSDFGGSGIVFPLAVEYAAADGSLKTTLAYALGRLDATSVLSSELAYGDARTRARAAELLSLFNEDAATRALVGALRDPDTEVRINAAYALGDHQDPSTLTALTEGMRSDTVPAVRSACALALAALPGPGARAALETAAQHEEVVSVIILIERAIQRRIDRGEAE
ncbi:MAG: HEAT repeat domain-containing protein [Deltaproteobacteria bacterium]